MTKKQLLAYNRHYRQELRAEGHKSWLRRAFIKAGGSILDWPKFRKETPWPTLHV